MPAARQEHTAAQRGPVCSQNPVLHCRIWEQSLAGIGSHPGSPCACKKQDIPMQVNVLQNQGVEQKCGLQPKLMQYYKKETDLTRQNGPSASG